MDYNNEIKVIEEYLKYFPDDGTAIGNLLLYKCLNDLNLEKPKRYGYPRLYNSNWKRVELNEQMSYTKSFELTNRTTKYNFENKDENIILWSEPCGRLAFTSQKYWFVVEEEWEWLMNKLLSYHPLDYDKVNSNYIYNIENGKKLYEDYPDIIAEFKEKINVKIQKKIREEKLSQLKQLEKELYNK